jgi:hypothetical protein
LKQKRKIAVRQTSSNQHNMSSPMKFNPSPPTIDSGRIQESRLQEVLLLLKETPQSDSDWQRCQTTTEEASQTCQQLDEFCKNAQIPIGNLLRILLPFNEETSTYDQTITFHGTTSSKKNSNNSNNSNHSNHNGWASVCRESLVQESSWKLSTEEIENLIFCANNLRKLRAMIRVKIADASDFVQVNNL